MSSTLCQASAGTGSKGCSLTEADRAALCRGNGRLPSLLWALGSCSWNCCGGGSGQDGGSGPSRGGSRPSRSGGLKKKATLLSFSSSLLDASDLSASSKNTQPSSAAARRQFFDESNLSKATARRQVSCMSERSDLSKERKEITCLRAVRQQFQAFDANDSGDISPEELALCWARAASSNYGRALQPAELALIAARVERSFAELDVRRSGRIDVDEWMHCALMDRYSPGPAAAAAIAERIREEDNERTIHRLVRGWVSGDPQGTGIVLREVLPQLEISKRDLGLMLDAMNADMAQDLSYAEYCAHHFGLQSRRVELYLYDLSKSMASYLSPILVGHTEEGIWHSGVVVFGHEHYYYGTICMDWAGETPFGPPTKVLQLGFTLRTEDELQEFLEGLDKDFQPQLYDSLEHNCNHLSDAVVFFLLGRHIPNSVRLMSDRLRNALIVKALRPVLNRALGQCEQASKPRTSRSRPSLSGKATTESTAAATGDAWSSLTSLLAYDLGDDVDLVLAEVPDCCEPVAAHVLREHEEGTFDLAWFHDAGHFRVTEDVPRADVRPLRDNATREGSFGRYIYETALRSLKEAGTSFFQPELSILQEESPEAEESEAWRSVCPRGHALQASRPRCWQGRVRRKPCGRCGRHISRLDVRLECGTCKYRLCENCWERRTSSSQRLSTKCRPSLLNAGPDVRCPKEHPMELMAGQAMCDGGACAVCGQQDLGATAPYFYSCRLCLYCICPTCARHTTHCDLMKGWNARLKRMAVFASSLTRSGSDWSKVSHRDTEKRWGS